MNVTKLLTGSLCGDPELNGQTLEEEIAYSGVCCLLFIECRPHIFQLGVSFNASSTKTEEEIPPPNADVKVD